MILLKFVLKWVVWSRLEKIPIAGRCERSNDFRIPWKMSSLVSCRTTSNIFPSLRYSVSLCQLHFVFFDHSIGKYIMRDWGSVVRGVLQSSGMWCQVSLSLPLHCKVHLNPASLYRCSWHCSWTCNTSRHYFKPWYLNWSLYKDVCPKRFLTIYKTSCSINL